MKYTILYIAAGMLAMASCSRDNETPVVQETPQTAVDSEATNSPVSWLARAYTSEELQKVEDAIGAIRGAGYTYRDNESYCVGTDMEVFNMRSLRDMERKYNTSYIQDDYIPVNEQKFFYSESIKELKDQLSLDIGIGFDVGVFALDLDVAFNKKKFSTTKNYYSMMRMKQSYFSRDLNYLNLREQVANAIAASTRVKNTYPSIDADSLAKEVPVFGEVYAPGFSEVMQKFIRKIHAAPSAFAASGICREFIDEVGSGFVTRSVLGCSLDYYNTTRMDSVSNSLDVKVALEMSVQIKFITVGTSMSTEYHDAAMKCSRNSESHITARGGNVSLVTAFTTGQQATIDTKTLKEWQATVTPQDAALIDIRLVPIYEVIYDQKTRTILKNYMDKSLRNYEDE
ncbi:MAG: hypothetical protein E7107_03050 [Prevotella sp.]|nr:hypothetical protein [Prevotella sp.]